MKQINLFGLFKQGFPTGDKHNLCRLSLKKSDSQPQQMITSRENGVLRYFQSHKRIVVTISPHGRRMAVPG